MGRRSFVITILIISLSLYTLVQVKHTENLIVSKTSISKTSITSNIALSTPQIRNATGDTTIATNKKIIHNFFGCKKDYDHQPLCTYFKVKEFFEAPTGLGYNYRGIAFRYARDLIYRDLRFYHIHCSENDVTTSSTTSVSIPSNLNYIHIHKNGGTTIREAFYNLRNLSQSSTASTTPSCRTKIYETEEILLSSIKITRAQLVHNVSTIMNFISTKQNQESNENLNNVVLSFVRDPVMRFLSQVGETIRQGVKHNTGHPGPVFGCREKSTAREAIKCIIKEIKVNGTIVDTHYTPAAVELYLADSRRGGRTKGVAINLYDMKYLRLFLNILHYENGNVKMRSATSKEYNEYFDFTLEDLSNEMIQDICKIYEMDVILLNLIGISSTFCQIS